MEAKLGDLGRYKDQAGNIHEDAQCVYVWPDGAVNVVYTEGGTRYADCNVPVITREVREQPGRFFEKGAGDD